MTVPVSNHRRARSGTKCGESAPMQLYEQLGWIPSTTLDRQAETDSGYSADGPRDAELSTRKGLGANGCRIRRDTCDKQPTAICWFHCDCPVGISHGSPTKPVVDGWGSVAEKSRLIMIMEWAAEGLTLRLIGLLGSFSTILRGAPGAVSIIVHRAPVLTLMIMAG